MEDFKIYYQFPLKPLPELEDFKVVTNNRKDAFIWCERTDKTFREKILSIINGDNKTDDNITDVVWFYENGHVYYDNGAERCQFIRIRGWGMLVGSPNHLTREEAIFVQDSFGKYITKQLNGK